MAPEDSIRKLDPVTVTCDRDRHKEWEASSAETTAAANALRSEIENTSQTNYVHLEEGTEEGKYGLGTIVRNLLRDQGEGSHFDYGMNVDFRVSGTCEISHKMANADIKFGDYIWLEEIPEGDRENGQKFKVVVSNQAPGGPASVDVPDESEGLLGGAESFMARFIDGGKLPGFVSEIDEGATRHSFNHNTKKFEFKGDASGETHTIELSSVANAAGDDFDEDKVTQALNQISISERITHVNNVIAELPEIDGVTDINFEGTEDYKLRFTYQDNVYELSVSDDINAQNLETAITAKIAGTGTAGDDLPDKTEKVDTADLLRQLMDSPREGQKITLAGLDFTYNDTYRQWKNGAEGEGVIISAKEGNDVTNIKVANYNEFGELVDEDFTDIDTAITYIKELPIVAINKPETPGKAAEPDPDPEETDEDDETVEKNAEQIAWESTRDQARSAYASVSNLISGKYSAIFPYDQLDTLTSVDGFVAAYETDYYAQEWENENRLSGNELQTNTALMNQVVSAIEGKVSLIEKIEELRISIVSLVPLSKIANEPVSQILDEQVSYGEITSQNVDLLKNYLGDLEETGRIARSYEFFNAENNSVDVEGRRFVGIDLPVDTTEFVLNGQEHSLANLPDDIQFEEGKLLMFNTSSNYFFFTLPDGRADIVSSNREETPTPEQILENLRLQSRKALSSNVNTLLENETAVTDHDIIRDIFQYNSRYDTTGIKEKFATIIAEIPDQRQQAIELLYQNVEAENYMPESRVDMFLGGTLLRLNYDLFTNFYGNRAKQEVRDFMDDIKDNTNLTKPEVASYVLSLLENTDFDASLNEDQTFSTPIHEESYTPLQRFIFRRANDLGDNRDQFISDFLIPTLEEIRDEEATTDEED